MSQPDLIFGNARYDAMQDIVIEHKGVFWQCRKTRALTDDERAAQRAKQAACKHDSGYLLLTSPPMCPLCLKVMG